MASRVIPVSIPGSLLKAQRKPKEKREKAPDHLALIRRCPCLACDADPAGEAAHIRMAYLSKPITGVGIKPDDNWTVPLCHTCHMRQHAMGENQFWRELGIDPHILSSKLWVAGLKGDIERMRAAVFAERELRK